MQRKCKCHPGCNFWPTPGYAGYNKDHHPDPGIKQRKFKEAVNRQKKRTASRNAGSKLRRSISKNMVDNEAKKKFEKLQLWYDEIKRSEQNICWETGDLIPYSYMRSATAHILPKKEGIGGFPSVSTHPFNYIILSPINGSHQKFDKSWQDAQKMKIWPIVVERFKKIYPAIDLEERKYLPDCLLAAISDF